MIGFLTVQKAFSVRTHAVVLILRKCRSTTNEGFEEKSRRDAMKIYRFLENYLPNSTFQKLVRILYEKHPRLLENVHMPSAS